MAGVYFDTSVLVPAIIAQHPHHESALARLKEVAQRKRRGHISAHGIAEFYSVLTRAPFKPPLHPSEVWRLIEEVILPHLELVTLTAEESLEVTRACATSGWTGNRIHDAMHLRCALKTKCEWIYTFKVKDFRSLAAPEMMSRIVAP